MPGVLKDSEVLSGKAGAGVPGPRSQLGQDVDEQGQGLQCVARVEHEPNAFLGSTDSGISLASLVELI